MGTHTFYNGKEKIEVQDTDEKVYFDTLKQREIDEKMARLDDIARVKALNTDEKIDLILKTLRLI